MKWGQAEVSNPLASIRITAVEREKNIVIFKVVSDAGYPAHLMTAQFKGPYITNLPLSKAKYQYTGPDLNCLLSPSEATTGYGDGTSYIGNDLGGWIEIVAWTPTKRFHMSNKQIGPGEFLYGFYLPDESTAALVVAQGRESLLGKTNLLGESANVLTFFDLKRRAGKDRSGNKQWQQLTGSLVVSPDYNVSFGPVIEQALTMNGEEPSGCLNLVSGEIAPLPQYALGGWLPAGTKVPPATSLPMGIGVFKRIPDPNEKLSLYASGGMVLRYLSNEKWESMSTAEALTVARTMQTHPEPTSYVGNLPPSTFLFKTPKGLAGLLQLTAFTDNQRGVNIRYKLVQSPGTTIPLPPGYGAGQPVPLPPGYQPGQAPPLPLAYQWMQNSTTNSAVDTEATRELKPIPPEAAVLSAALKADMQSFGSTHDRKDTNARAQFIQEVDVRQNEIYKLLQGTIAEPLLNKQLELMKVMAEKAKQNNGYVDHKLLAQLEENGKPLEAMIMAAIPAATSPLITEPPKLQFLAWQDEWQTNQPGAARHPDGSPVTNETELKWLKAVQFGGMDVSSWHLSPEPRFLKLWFSDPGFDLGSFSEVALLDNQNKIIPIGARGSMSGSAEEGSEPNGNLGWQVKTFSPNEGTNLPPRVTVRLRYTIGPLEKTQEVPVTPNHSLSMTLEDGSMLNGVGQNVDGRAFVAIAVHAHKPGLWRFGVVAVTKDGRHLTTGPSESGFPDGTGVSVAEFTFSVPLADVAKFIIGTRPIRTLEWTNVVLPNN